MAPTFLQPGVDRFPYLVRLAQDGRILDVNTAGLAVFGGATRSAVVGSSIYAYLAEEHRSAMRSLIRNACSDTASTNVEFEMVAPGGAGRCTINARTARLTAGEEGLSILCVFEDVTEQRERELQPGERESEAHRLAKTAHTERQALETQLASARAHSGQVEREYAAARHDWEEARERLQTAAAAEAANRECLKRQVRDALASASEYERRFKTAADFLLEGKTLFRAIIDQERANRDTLAQNLADAQAALKEAERRHVSQMTDATAQLAERQAQYDTELAQSAAARDRLAQQLREADGAFERAQQNWAADAAAAAERLTRRDAELAATLAEATATQETLELRLADGEIALQQAEQRVSDERLAATHASRRQAEVEVQLAQEIANREHLERDLADRRAAVEQAQRCFLDEAAAVMQRAREHEALLEQRFARERVDQESIRAGMQDEIRHLQLERDTLHQSLDTSQEELQRLKSENNEARENIERIRMASEAELQRLAAEYTGVQQTIEQVRTNLEQKFERASSEHAAERARLETLVTERDTQLKEHAARHSASQRAAKDALMQIEDRLSLALEASSRDRREIEQLQAALEDRGQQLEASRSEREALRTEADRVPQLQSQLDDSRAENRRQFDQTPYGICRCSRNGALKHVNDALVALLGYRTSDELQTVDFATIFESRDDLRLLIERCLSKGTMESVEATWRRKDSGRLVVQLRALAATAESIEIVVEDITNLRALQEKLRQVRPMEAMARLATEVAGTCDNMLRNVSQDAQQWLATIDSDTPSRHEGERLLHEVTRAAGFLRQLAVYGKKQAIAIEPVDVNKVLRDLEPVLRRVAGDDIEFVMPKTLSPVNVDVELERVERVLVNVASYGRERMPFGGRLRIELATVVVGSKFVSKYPNVRPGDHVLITAEVRGGLRSVFSIRPQKAATGANTMRSVSDRPGVDLGVLQGLLRDCGGHLWMKANPIGGMVLKMHLPQPGLDGPAEPVPNEDVVRFWGT